MTMLLLLVALAPQSMSQDSLSCDSSRLYCCPQHKHTVLFQTDSALRFTFIDATPLCAPAQHSHTHQPLLLLTALSNTCPSAPIAGHNAIPPSSLLQV